MPELLWLEASALRKAASGSGGAGAGTDSRRLSPPSRRCSGTVSSGLARLEPRQRRGRAALFSGLRSPISPTASQAAEAIYASARIHQEADGYFVGGTGVRAARAAVTQRARSPRRRDFAWAGASTDRAIEPGRGTFSQASPTRWSGQRGGPLLEGSGSREMPLATGACSAISRESTTRGSPSKRLGSRRARRWPAALRARTGPRVILEPA